MRSRWILVLRETQVVASLDCQFETRSCVAGDVEEDAKAGVCGGGDVVRPVVGVD